MKTMRVATVFLLLWVGGRGAAIEVGAIQALVKKSYHLTNTLLGEFKNNTQHIIKNKITLSSHKYLVPVFDFY